MQNAITIVSTYFQNLRYGTFSKARRFFYRQNQSAAAASAASGSSAVSGASSVSAALVWSVDNNLINQIVILNKLPLYIRTVKCGL